MNDGPFRASPWEPFDHHSRQKIFLEFLPALGEDKILMSSSFQSFDKGKEERRLNEIIRMGRKGRGDNANVHFLVTVTGDSDGNFKSERDHTR
jgi:hypothetical protein